MGAEESIVLILGSRVEIEISTITRGIVPFLKTCMSTEGEKASKKQLVSFKTLAAYQ